MALLRGSYSILDLQTDAAEQYFRDAHVLDPRSQVFAESFINSLAAAGKLDEARDVSDRAVQAVHARALLDQQWVRLGF